MADQNGFAAVSTNKMDSRTHVKSIMQREGITIESFAKIKQKPQKFKEFSNISTPKYSYNSEPNFGKSNPACKSIFNPQFGLECKRNMLDAGDILDLSLPQSSQRTDAEGISGKVNILNSESNPRKLNSKSINDVEIEQKVLKLKEDKARIQCLQGNDLDSNSAIDLSLRKDKIEISKDTATEEIKNSSYSNASWQNKNVKDPVALTVAIKANLEEAKGRNQCSKEIQPKYEHNSVSVVENPVALQKRFKCVKGSRKKYPLTENSENSFNEQMQSELKHSHENSRSSETLTAATKFVSKQDFVLKKEPAHQSIALKELSIKCENSNTPQDNSQELCSQRNLYDKRYSYHDDLNTSLCVNIDTLSNANTDDKDLNDQPSIQSCGLNSNNSQFSLNKTISEEVEDKSLSLKTNSLIEKKKKMKNNAISSRILRKTYKTRQKTSRRNTNLKEPMCKTSKRGRKPKATQTSNCIEKDSTFRTGRLIKRKIKNLPKTTTETRIKEKNKINAAKKGFPKPFKLENIPPRLHGIAIELPKPIMFKQEFQTDIRNTELYQQPAFQPHVRLKRLSSEDLLVPLKTKKVRKGRTKDTYFADRHLNNCSQTTNEDNKDLIIHQAFSLNPRNKLKQINGSHDHSYDQPSLDSCMTTSLSVTNDNNNHLWNDSQELFPLFHHGTSKHDSMISGNTDSGVSTSTPKTLHHCYDDNIQLLLEIAAERAFINNHLKEFGYSPIQFQLYNDFNELNIFLKYLIDKMDIN